MSTNITHIAAIDELGVLRAQMAELKIQEDLLKTRLGDLPVGSYDGQIYRLTIFEVTRETQDALLKAKIAELIEEHISRQYLSAHTSASTSRTCKTAVRKERAVAA